MNFNSLVNKLEILEEAKAGRFDKLFNTGYLKKAIEEKKIGVARPIVFEFIINFLKEKGMVPEGTAFAGSRYAAEAGEFIKNLVDSGVIKDEIADEFKQYLEGNLSSFLQRKQQVRSRGKGENIGKSFGSKEEFQQFGKVKTPEEMAAEKQAKKEKKQAMADDISPIAPYEFTDYLVNIVSKVPLDIKLVTKILTAASNGKSVSVDDTSTPTNIDISLDPESAIVDKVKKNGADATADSLSKVLPKYLKVDAEDLEVFILSPGTMDIESDVKSSKPKTKSQRTGVDLQGYGMGTIAQDDSARRLANPFEDEEVLVQNENHKPKVTFVSTKDRFKPKNSWQQAARAEMFYR
jgi:hypothetical protein